MPTIYLSPSTQEYNPYYGGEGNEEYYMNLIADAMEPYLTSSGIGYVRNTPDMTAASSIAASNQGGYDVHLALHSNASPPSMAGLLRGTDVYYNPSSARSEQLAEIIANNLKYLYPDSSLVKAVPTTSLGEVVRTRAPGVLVEFAYHDNPDDAAWIRANIQNLARNIVLSLTEYFGIPFIEPSPARQATADLSSGYLNIRSRPAYDAPVVATAADGEPLTVLGAWNGWFLVRRGGDTGYVRSEYITLNY